MTKYLDANGVKRLASQLWAKMKTLVSGKEDVRPTKYVTIGTNNSTTTLDFGSDYYVLAPAVTVATLSVKLPTGWKDREGTLHMDIMLRSDSGAKISVVNADGFGIFKTMDFASMYTKGGMPPPPDVVPRAWQLVGDDGVRRAPDEMTLTTT